MFAFAAIEHLKGDLRHYLGGVETLLSERENIAVCVDLPDLDVQLPKTMVRLGVPDFDMPPKPKTHQAPTPLPEHSAQTEDTLRTHWADEFELYDTACDIARQLGFSG